MQLASSWASFLARPELWERWLTERAARLSDGESRIAVLLAARNEETYLLLGPNGSDLESHRVSRIASKDAAVMDRLAEIGRWPAGAVNPELAEHWLLRGVRCVTAAPLPVDGIDRGVVAVTSRNDAPPSSEALAEWGLMLGEGLARRHAAFRAHLANEWRLGVLAEIGSKHDELHHRVTALLRKGLDIGVFQVVGVLLLDREHAAASTLAALERLPHAPDATPAPLALPAVGRMLRETLLAGKAVTIGPSVGRLYLRDAPKLAAFMTARDFAHLVAAPVGSGDGVAGALLAFGHDGAGSADARAGVVELGASVGVVLGARRELEEAVAAHTAAQQALDDTRFVFGRALDLLRDALQDRPLHQSVRSLADLVGAPLLVESPSFEIRSMAWPSGVPAVPIADHEWLALRAPLQTSDALRDLRGTDTAPLILSLPEAFPHAATRSLMPVVVDGELAAYVSSLHAADDDLAEASARLPLAAAIVGVHLLREQVAQDVQHRLTGELINELLGGRADESINRRLERLDHHFTPPYYLVLIAWHVDEGHARVAAPTPRMVQGLTAQTLSRQHPEALISYQDGHVLFAIEGDAEKAAADAARRVVAAVERTFHRTSATATVSRRLGHLWEMEAGYREACKVLQLVQHLGSRGKVVSVGDLRGYTALLQTDNLDDLVGFARHMLQPLLAYDAERGSELVRTLHSYLRNWGHQRTVAAECAVHVSTLKYRLARISEIAGLDLADQETRTQALLACQVVRTLEALNGDPLGARVAADDAPPMA